VRCDDGRRGGPEGTVGNWFQICETVERSLLGSRKTPVMKWVPIPACRVSRWFVWRHTRLDFQVWREGGSGGRYIVTFSDDGELLLDGVICGIVWGEGRKLDPS
jgi:hypothetical protein